MKLRHWLLAGVAALPLFAAGEKLNFYLPPDAEKKSEKKPPEKVAPKKSDSGKSNSPAKSKSSEPEEDKRSPAKSTTAKNLHLRERDSESDSSFNPPLDEFGLARAFKHRWDFSSFIITPEEELRFRLNAARKRTLRIAQAFTTLSNEVEARQRNLNAAALAAYLLSRDQATWAPLGGRNLTEAQMLAVRATMRQDIKAMDDALSDYEILRTSLNESAEKLAALEKNGLDAAPAALPGANRPTVPYTTLATAETAGVLDERIISVQTLKAILAAEKLSVSGDRRQSIASFAPPPPQVRQAAPPFASVDEKTAGINAAEHANMKRPEQTALLVPTDINAPVHAVRDGVVAYAGPFRGYGGMVIIEHEKGTFSVYSHLETIQVRERQPVKAGAIIGRAGTPPELGRSGIHFQVRSGKKTIKPSDWLGSANVEKLLKG